MGHRPRTVSPDDLVSEAAELLGEAKIDQLPVVDARGKLVGLLDVQDLLAAKVL
jgi:arabinose-5-phosphate isomerase